MILIFFIAATSNSNSLSKVNTMYLSKEATEKDRQMKMQMFMSTDNSDSSPSEMIWVNNSFFGDQRSDLTVSKEKFLKTHFCTQIRV